MRQTLICSLVAALSWPLAQPAAEELPVTPFYELGPLVVEGDEPDALSLGAGAFDVSKDQTSAAAAIEYRFGRKLWFLGAGLGLVANTDGGVVGYGGVYMDLSAGPVVLTPLLGIAGAREGDGRNLGSLFQFRAQGDLTYRFADGTRLGLRFAHISNANTNDPNPGEEELLLIGTIALAPFE
jgi:lipid A 3-O-deacylase